jgi:hypothetical protein
MFQLQKAVGVMGALFAARAGVSALQQIALNRPQGCLLCDVLTSRGCLRRPQLNDRLKGDHMELPLSVAACAMDRSTSKRKPMAELLVECNPAQAASVCVFAAPDGTCRLRV